jgi:hypothetical protein
MADRVVDNSLEPVGVILLKDEPEEMVLIKFIAWLIVMVLFIAILIIVSGYFSNKKCDMDGFLLRQERTDIGAV